jgi:hypothetical protein
MLGIPRRYWHFLFAVMQAALTSAIAAATASVNLLAQSMFLRHWLQSWLLAWILMLPVVIFFAPPLNRFSVLLTQPDRPKPNAG